MTIMGLLQFSIGKEDGGLAQGGGKGSGREYSLWICFEEAFHLFTCDSCDPLTSCTL